MPDGLNKHVIDVKTKAAETGYKVRIGVNAFGIARPTEPEARAVRDEILVKANP